MKKIKFTRGGESYKGTITDHGKTWAEVRMASGVSMIIGLNQITEVIE